MCAAVCRWCFSICVWAGNIWLGCKESQRQAEHLPHAVLFTGLWRSAAHTVAGGGTWSAEDASFSMNMNYGTSKIWRFALSLSPLFTVTVLHFSTWKNFRTILIYMYVYIYMFQKSCHFDHEVWRNDENGLIQVLDFQRDTSMIIIEWSPLNCQWFVKHPEFVLISQPAE